MWFAACSPARQTLPAGTPRWRPVGHAKDSLWSVDLFRCESLSLTTHWVMLVVDQCTRRIVGLSIQTGVLDGAAVCRMFARIVASNSVNGVPLRLSSDHDPLFEFHRWKANLRILEIEEIKTVPYVPLSHPFVERLIGTVRREFLDHVPFWNARDLERKLAAFMAYYNEARSHRALDGETPVRSPKRHLPLDAIRWQPHCRGLFQLPIPALSNNSHPAGVFRRLILLIRSSKRVLMRDPTWDLRYSEEAYAVTLNEVS
jgi:transposase InsO family protein